MLWRNHNLPEMFHQIQERGISQLLLECPGQRAWGTHTWWGPEAAGVPKHRWEGTRQHTLSSGSALLSLLLRSPEDWLPGDGMAALVRKVLLLEGAVDYKSPSKGKPQESASSLIRKVDGALTGYKQFDYARSQGSAHPAASGFHCPSNGPSSWTVAADRTCVSPLGSWLSLGSRCKTTLPCRTLLGRLAGFLS